MNAGDNLGAAVVAALAGSSASVEDLSGARLDAAALVAQAQALADALRAAGLARDEPVALIIDNAPVDLVGYLGLWLAGCVAVPIHVGAPQAAVQALMARVRNRFVVRAGAIERIAATASAQRALLRGAAIVVFTSGSTGEPKGVVIGHARLLGKLSALARLLQFTAQDVVAAPLQLTFIFGVWVALLSLMSGARLVLGPKFSATEAGATYRQATILAAVPTLLRALCAQGAGSPALRKILTGGEPFAPALGERLAGLFPDASIYDLFGLTETGSCDFCLHPDDQPAGHGSIGRVTEGVRFRIAPTSVTGLPAGAGELQIDTPFGMLGYLDADDLTAAAFADGWFRTGDLAVQRADGFVQLVGRSKDIVSRGGNKIAPLEIENVFTRHDAVAAALAFGYPDERLGESLQLLVVRRDPGLSAQALRDWASGRIERFKLPDAILFVDALPAGRTGKADRGAAQKWLRERAKSAAEAASLTGRT